MSFFSAVVGRNFTAPLLSVARTVRRPDRQLQRASRLVRLGDALSTTRPRNWETRSRRAYRKAVRILGSVDPATAPDGIVPDRAARALVRARMNPARLAALRLALSVTVVVTVVVGLIAAVPGLRARFWPNDLARGRRWAASSAVEGYADAGVDPGGSPAFFHTRSERHPWVTVELPGSPAISSIQVENRSDCCAEAALPLNVEVLDGDHYRIVCQRRATFSRYTCEFPRVRTASVRIHLAATGVLHLKRVAIFE